MAVVGGQFIYDVSDPIHPRLVCRTSNTYLHLDGNAITYTTVAAKKVYVVRRDLTTGAESSVGLLPADPVGSKELDVRRIVGGLHDVAETLEWDLSDSGSPLVKRRGSRAVLNRSGSWGN